MQFTFWKDNKTDQEFTLTDKELLAKLDQWLYTKELCWLQYYPGTSVLQCFISKGLSSVFNESEFDAMYLLAKPVIKNFIHTIEKLSLLFFQHIKRKAANNPYEFALEELVNTEKDLTAFIKDLVEQQTANGELMEVMFGKEIGDLLITLPVPTFEIL